MPAFSLPEHPMKWDEFQSVIREAMAAQPRGYQTRLAHEMDTTPGYVHQLVVGHRSIPADKLPAILASLGIEYDIRLRSAKKE